MLGKSKCSHTAIVVDDDKDTADAFCDHLEMYGINVLGKGSNGQDALELYKKFKPDVVLMDVMMPGYDGIYGLNKIMEHDGNAKLIMVTADFTGKTEGELKRPNVSVVFKPYDIEHVINTIDATCNKNL